MTGTINNGGPAFPLNEKTGNGAHYHSHEGMTLRQYAAIKLRVPDSGDEWLDEMIRKSLCDEFAAKALQGLLVDPDRADQSREECARLSYLMADAMLKARSAPRKDAA